MNKLYFLTVFLTLMISCDKKSDYEALNADIFMYADHSVKTKIDDQTIIHGSGESDYSSSLSQIQNIPVRIFFPPGLISPDQQNMRFRNPVSGIELMPNLNNSNQYFLIKPSGTHFLVQNIEFTRYLGYNDNNTTDSSLKPVISKYDTYLWSIEEVPEKYNKFYFSQSNYTTSNRHYLQGDSYNSTSLKMSRTKNLYSEWEISPVEDLEILEISYEFIADDYLRVLPKLVKSVPVYNNSQVPVNYEMTLSETVTNSSSFSTTKGIRTSFTNSATIKIGIPLFSNSTINTSATSEQTWSYSQNTTQTVQRTISEKISYTVPPYTTIHVKLICREYNAKVSYVAKCRGVTTQNIMYLKGTWNGVVVQEDIIEITDGSGNILKTWAVH